MGPGSPFGAVCEGYNGSAELSVVQVYNLNSNSWTTQIASMPTVTMNASAADVNGIIYVIGGYSNYVEYYNTYDNYWGLATMPYANSAMGVVSVNNIVYSEGRGSGGRVSPSQRSIKSSNHRQIEDDKLNFRITPTFKIISINIYRVSTYTLDNKNPVFSIRSSDCIVR